MMNSAGDGLPLLVILNLLRIELLFWERKNFAGDKKALSTTLFPWLLAEDNPVISWWGNNI